MACTEQSAVEYLSNARPKLVSRLQNFPLIIENLYQRKVFNDHHIDSLNEARTEFAKARRMLDCVINMGEEATYELLRILDVTRKKTLHSDLHHWISCFSFREEVEVNYSLGTRSCQIYQTQLKSKAESILKKQREQSSKYLQNKNQENVNFIPLVLEMDSVVKTPQSKIEMKSKKCQKLRPKKLKAYIPNEEQKLLPADLLKWQDKNILLIGKPGIGKTTAVQQILHLWTEKDVREPDYMFYFDEGVLAHSSSLQNLESLLFDMYVKPKEKNRKEIFQDIEENSENVVIIFDGIICVEEHSVVKKVMDHELLPEAKVIITCRTEAEDESLFSDWPTRKVYVQGFSEESIRTYYQEMLGHDSDLRDIVLNNQELFSLSHVPMYAFMVVSFIQFKNDHRNQPHTVTELYVHIFRHALKKHGGKTFRQIDPYMREIKDQLHCLMKNAFNATMQKQLNLSDINSDETDVCHVFLKMITVRNSLTSAKTYCAFLHNTMQEFFSALWLLGNPSEINKFLQLCQKEENKHMIHILPFLCGLLGEHITLLNCLFPEDEIKKTLFIERLIDTFIHVDLLYGCQCLYELQSSKACLMFLEKVDHQLDPEAGLDPHQCCALAFVISQSREKEVYLNLEDCTMCDAGMKMILSCSSQIRLKLWSRPLNHIKFLLEFFHKVCRRDEIMTSQCCCTSFDSKKYSNPELIDALLDLYSHVKDYETQTGRSFLPALQSVYQSAAPDVWSIDLSERKTSLLLEVLKLQTEKKPVELRGCSEEESEVMSFLQCLPHISQLRFTYCTTRGSTKFLLRLFIEAAEIETQTGEQMLKLLTPVCSHYYIFYKWSNSTEWCDFLLDLYSHVKDYETQTGRSFLPALQSVYQSAPDVWSIDLSKRKTSLLLEVLKLQTVKKPVELRGWSEEESEVMSFLQCLPHISQLRFKLDDEDSKMSAVKFLLSLSVKAVEYDTVTGQRFSTLLSSVCSYKTFPFNEKYYEYMDDAQSDFLLDLYSHVKHYETLTGRSFPPALQSVYQSAAPDVWSIDLSERKASLLLEVLKLQTEKKPVELRGCSEEESEVMSVLQCLPHISQLSLLIKAAEIETQTGEQMLKLLTSVCTYRSFPYEQTDRIKQSDFLLDLYSHVKDYETQTGRSFLPALQSVYQSAAPDVWYIDLSKRKTSLHLEVLKLQTVKKPVELRGCSEEESDVMSFLQCLPHISQLRLSNMNTSLQIKFLLSLLIKAAEIETQTGEQMLKLLTSVCTYRSFPYEQTDRIKQNDFLLDLYSHVKDYETQTGRSFLPALQSVYQSAAPDVWSIDLSERKISLLLEVLKLQTVKKPVELRGCSEEESEVMSFLQCLPHISQLRLSNMNTSLQIKFLLSLLIKAAEIETQTGEQMLKLLASVCTYRSFPYEWTDRIKQSDLLLDLYSHVKHYETQTGRSFPPALQSVYQSAPDVWSIDLSERKTSLLLEVLKLQTEKKPVKLRGCSEEESEVMSVLQCLPHISQLRFDLDDEDSRMPAVKFLLSLSVKAVENDTVTGQRFSTLLSSVCSYKTFPFNDYEYMDDAQSEQSDFLLDLYSHVKHYETQTGRSFLPALQSVYQSAAPDVWSLDLSERKISLLLEVLKLQTEKKPVELRGCSEEESEVMSVLQCLPHISQLRLSNMNTSLQIKFLLRLLIKAAEIETQTGEQMLKLLTSVCTYRSFPYEQTDRIERSDFLLDLYSHVKHYETQTGRSFLPALQSVYQSAAPDVWYIDLSERKISLLLEVLKLQTEKKPVELRGCSEEESEVMSVLQCLPHISQLSFYLFDSKTASKFLLSLLIKAAEIETQTGEQMLKLLTSVCTYRSFPYEQTDRIEQSDLLLDLYSHVKHYESQTGRSFLPALQSVYQSAAPDVWYIDLSERKISLLLEVLKLQTVKKPVELRGCSEEESEVMSFLQCLPHISQLRFDLDDEDSRMPAVKFLLSLSVKAVENDTVTGQRFSTLLSSVCSYKTFPFNDYEYMDDAQSEQSDFLLDLYSHVKHYETQTGRSFLPALQSVYQSAAPDVWYIDLSERKISLLLEVLKLQTEKKPVELRGCSEEESEVMSFLQCLPHISQLRLSNMNTSLQIKFLLRLLIKAAEIERRTGEQMLKLLTSVCTYRSFPYEQTDRIEQSDFLLDLYSHVKHYESQTGRSFLPALQSVYQSAAPDVWSIDLSERKISLLLEVLKLQTEKKPVELRGWSEEESEVMSVLQCLPHISQLSGAERCVLSLVKLVQFRENPELVSLVFQSLGFCLFLDGQLPSSTCRSVGRILQLSADRLNLTVKPQAISLRGARLLFTHITHLHTLRLSEYMVVRIVQALRSARGPITVDELSLELNSSQCSERVLSRVLSSLASFLRLWTVKCLNLTEYKMESVSLTVLLCHQGPLNIRVSKETLQKLVKCVYEVQDEELTQSFLQKVGGDLTSCSLSWEELHYLLQHKIPHITVNLRERNMPCNMKEILPFLHRIRFNQMSSTFTQSLIREIYETGSAEFVSSLLSSMENCINLQCRQLDSVHCAALRFTLEHCSTVNLNMLWTSIPEGELKSILPLFNHLSQLSVDRLLMLKMLHCCSASDLQQGAACAFLLSALQHKLDLSCQSALDLTTETHTQTLHLTAEDCHVITTVIQRAHTQTHSQTHLIIQECEINKAGIDELLPVLHTVKLCCDKSTLLQFLAHVLEGSVSMERASALSRALGVKVDLSQIRLDLQACRGLALILEYSEGLTELDLSQCHLTDHCLDLLLPHLNKAQNIDLSNNVLTDVGAQNIYNMLSPDSNIKTVRLFNNINIKFIELFSADPRFEIW